jgi:hypothetical protein
VFVTPRCPSRQTSRKFRLKGKSGKKSAKDRFIPIPAKLVWKIKDRMRQPNAQPHDLVFPNGEGKPDGHFLRKLKAIAKKAGVETAELHRFRKTYADTLHEEGVSVNSIRIRLGHESLDVTLAYLKGKDADSEEAQEHANSSSLALHKQVQMKASQHGRFWPTGSGDLPFASLKLTSSELPVSYHLRLSSPRNHVLQAGLSGLLFSPLCRNGCCSHVICLEW